MRFRGRLAWSVEYMSGAYLGRFAGEWRGRRRGPFATCPNSSTRAIATAIVGLPCPPGGHNRHVRPRSTRKVPILPTSWASPTDAAGLRQRCRLIRADSTQSCPRMRSRCPICPLPGHPTRGRPAADPRPTRGRLAANPPRCLRATPRPGQRCRHLLSFAVGAGSWCSGLTCQPVTLEIAGSNPVEPAIRAHLSPVPARTGLFLWGALPPWFRRRWCHKSRAKWRAVTHNL